MAAMATLLKRQNPMALSCSAWWPGGLTAQKTPPLETVQTVSMPAKTAPAASRAALMLAALIHVSGSGATSLLRAGRPAGNLCGIDCVLQESVHWGSAGLDHLKILSNAKALPMIHQVNQPLGSFGVSVHDQMIEVFRMGINPHDVPELQGRNVGYRSPAAAPTDQWECYSGFLRWTGADQCGRPRRAG